MHFGNNIEKQRTIKFDLSDIASDWKEKILQLVKT